MSTVTISSNTANALLTHLRNGGSRMEADLLADRFQNEANAPAIEATRKQELDAAIAEAISQSQQTVGRRPK